MFNTRHSLPGAPSDVFATLNTGRITGLGSMGRPLLLTKWMIWAIWAFLSLSLFIHVQKHGSPIPFADDWCLVPLLTGNCPLTVKTLWGQHNEHRFALPRLILLFLLKAAEGDFRAGTYATVCLLSASAAVMMAAACRIRGRSSYFDLFFPLTLLHYAQGETFTMSLTLGFSLPVFLLYTILAIMVRPGPRKQSHVVLVVILLALLPLCGGPGLPFVPLVTVWVANVIYTQRTIWHKPTQAAIMALAIVPMLLLVLYFYNYHRPPHVPVPREFHRVALFFARVLGLPFGLVAHSYWPLPVTIVATLLVICGGFALKDFLRRPDLCLQLAGILIVMIGTGCLGASIAWARAGLFHPSDGAVARYVTLMVPIRGAIFLYAVLSPGRVVGRLLQAFLFFLAVLFWKDNRGRFGVAEAKQFGLAVTAAYGELNTGEPGCVFAAQMRREYYPTVPISFTWPK